MLGRILTPDFKFGGKYTSFATCMYYRVLNVLRFVSVNPIVTGVGSRGAGGASAPPPPPKVLEGGGRAPLSWAMPITAVLQKYRFGMSHHVKFHK